MGQMIEASLMKSAVVHDPLRVHSFVAISYQWMRELFTLFLQTTLVAMIMILFCFCVTGDEHQTEDLLDILRLIPPNSKRPYYTPYFEKKNNNPYQLNNNYADAWWWYNKRAPGSEFLGKRAPGSEFLGKRVPGSEFLGKRVPGSEFLGKRVPGSEFLGKRVPGSEFLGKRVPGSEFLGKRVPGSEFLGKRVPGSEFLGKRVPGSEFLGKRSTTQNEDEFYNNVMQVANHQEKGSLEVPLVSLQKNARTRFESSKF